MSQRRSAIWVLLGSIAAANGLLAWAFVQASPVEPEGFALFESSPRDSVAGWWFLLDLLIVLGLIVWAVVARRRRRRVTPA